jgi:hypothetical protein
MKPAQNDSNAAAGVVKVALSNTGCEKGEPP